MPCTHTGVGDPFGAMLYSTSPITRLWYSRSGTGSDPLLMTRSLRGHAEIPTHRRSELAWPLKRIIRRYRADTLGEKAENHLQGCIGIQRQVRVEVLGIQANLDVEVRHEAKQPRNKFGPLGGRIGRHAYHRSLGVKVDRQPLRRRGDPPVHGIVLAGKRSPLTNARARPARFDPRGELNRIISPVRLAE